MTLTIHTEQDEQRQLKVTVEVDESRVEEQMRRTARELAREVDIPGFRRGRAPYNVIVQRVGRGSLRAEAVEELITPIFEEVMAEIEATPYTQPTLEEMEMEPLVIEFVVPLEPEVDLGDYRSLRREEIEPEVTDEAVQDSLEHIREHHQVVEPVDRPVQEGDIIAVSGTGEVVEESQVDVIFDEERTELLMDPEVTFPGTDFVANLLGLEVSDHTEFTITFPEEEPYLADEEEEEGAALAGKEAFFTLTILDVKSRYLPPLDDELAQQEGEFETLDELREALRKELQAEAEAEARADMFDGFLEMMAEQAEIVYPPAAVEEELDSMVANHKQRVTRAGWQWNDYLTLQSETEESLREQWRDAAAGRARRGLALREFILQEQLSLDDEEMEAAIEERVEEQFADNSEMQEAMRNFFHSAEGAETLANQLLLDKVYERMRAIATGNAPELEAPETEATEEADETAAIDSSGIGEREPDVASEVQTAATETGEVEEAADQVIEAADVADAYDAGEPEEANTAENI
ncbi:MAG: trigger factor [Candidatus Promineifilaceae bacterium]|nr:trigger factor [Candidatus Promineifilaceae bacterium]